MACDLWRPAILAGFLLAAPSLAYADSPPDDLVKVRSAFAAAVAANDVKGAARLTRFPLKNTVTAAPRTVTRAGFARQFKMYGEMKDCLKSEPFELASGDQKQASWVINCNGNIFHFALIDGRWLHNEYENINE